MHIVFANCYFAPAWGYGGPTRLLYELTGSLAGEGHQVTVITTDSADGYSRYPAGTTVERGVKIIRLPVVSQVLAYRYKKFFAAGYRAALREHLASADVVHLSGSRDFFVTVGAATARVMERPYVLAAYGCLPAGGRGWKKLVKPIFDRWYTARTVQGASLLFAQTEHEKELYRQFGGTEKQLRLVPLAADGERFSRLPERGSFRARIGLKPDDRVVLFVGRVNRLKGLDSLARAFATVAGRLPAARLVVVGRDDGYLGLFKALVGRLGIERKVVLAGPLYGDDVIGAYVDADLFALTPVHFEETTLAGLEACFCGVQVLVTEQAQIPFLVESGAGFTVPHTVARIAAAMEEALVDPGKIRSRGRAARELAYSRFDWRAVLPLYLQAYEEVRCAVGPFRIKNEME